MCHAANAAIPRSLTAGVVTSTTLMVPCAWAIHAMKWLATHPDSPVEADHEREGTVRCGEHAVLKRAHRPFRANSGTIVRARRRQAVCDHAAVAVASFRPNFIDYSPMSGWVRGEIAVYAGGGSNAHLTSFVLYEIRLPA